MALSARLRRRVRIRAGRDTEPSTAVIDAQSIKTSEGGEARGFDAGKRTTGRKRHVIIDTMGLLLVVAVTSVGWSETMASPATTNG